MYSVFFLTAIVLYILSIKRQSTRGTRPTTVRQVHVVLNPINNQTKSFPLSSTI
jgi:hypothetical protein